MSCKIRNMVVFLRIISDFILLRNFGKILFYCNHVSSVILFNVKRYKMLFGTRLIVNLKSVNFFMLHAMNRYTEVIRLMKVAYPFPL